MTTSVIYPPRATKALGHLKAHNNDIEIYVEDKSSPNLWLKLVRKCLPQGIQLTSVTVLGGRDNVIRACKADQARDSRRKLYIIDGDLDLLQGRRKPKLRHLYRLRSYSIENYLLDENAIISAVMTLNPKASENTVRREVDFLRWVERNRPVLSSLFVCYAVTNELRHEEQTIRFPVYRMFIYNDDGCNLSGSKVTSRIFSLYRSVRRQCSSQVARMAFNRVRGNADKLGILRFVSAKNYIFPSLYRVIKKNYHLNISSVAFSVLIAECIVGIADPYLTRRLDRICR